jgi:hypothetical protein
LRSNYASWVSKLVKKIHSDQRRSAYLTASVNEAKDALRRHHRKLRTLLRLINAQPRRSFWRVRSHSRQMIESVDQTFGALRRRIRKPELESQHTHQTPRSVRAQPVGVPHRGVPGTGKPTMRYLTDTDRAPWAEDVEPRRSSDQRGADRGGPQHVAAGCQAPVPAVDDELCLNACGSRRVAAPALMSRPRVRTPIAPVSGMVEAPELSGRLGARMRQPRG